LPPADDAPAGQWSAEEAAAQEVSQEAVRRIIRSGSVCAPEGGAEAVREHRGSLGPINPGGLRPHPRRASSTPLSAADADMDDTEDTEDSAAADSTAAAAGSAAAEAEAVAEAEAEAARAEGESSRVAVGVAGVHRKLTRRLSLAGQSDGEVGAGGGRGGGGGGEAANGAGLAATKTGAGTDPLAGADDHDDTAELLLTLQDIKSVLRGDLPADVIRALGPRANVMGGDDEDSGGGGGGGGGGGENGSATGVAASAVREGEGEAASVGAADAGARTAAGGAAKAAAGAGPPTPTLKVPMAPPRSAWAATRARLQEASPHGR
jgi:hypothetical protein